MKTMDVFILKSYSLRKTLIEMKKKANVCAKSAVQYLPIFYSYN